MKKYGLIGHPLSHSFSQRYFSEKFKSENIRDSIFSNYDIPHINQLKELLNGNQPVNILIDFSGVYGFCSAAEFVLIWANNKINDKGGKLALFCGNQNVMDLMIAFGLNKILNIFDDKQKAIDFLNG